MTTPMPSKLRQKRDEVSRWIENTNESDQYDYGFNACYAELAPMIAEMERALKNIVDNKNLNDCMNTAKYPDDGHYCLGQFHKEVCVVSRAALEKLKAWKE